MSRDWEEANTERLELTTPALTDVPFTISCWFLPENDVGAVYLAGLYDSGSVDNYHALNVNAADNLRASSRATGLSESSAVSVGTVTYGGTTWIHGCATFGPTTGTDRSISLAGATPVTATTNRAATGLDRIVLGCNYNGGAPIDFFDGLMAHVAFWNVQLSTREQFALSRGVHPRFIRPINLLHYWPLWGQASPEPDEARGSRGSLTLVNSPAARAFNPPVMPFAGSDDKPVVIAAPRAFVPRVIQHIT